MPYTGDAIDADDGTVRKIYCVGERSMDCPATEVIRQSFAISAPYGKFPYRLFVEENGNLVSRDVLCGWLWQNGKPPAVSWEIVRALMWILAGALATHISQTNPAFAEKAFRAVADKASPRICKYMIDLSKGLKFMPKHVKKENPATVSILATCALMIGAWFVLDGLDSIQRRKRVEEYAQEEARVKLAPSLSTAVSRAVARGNRGAIIRATRREGTMPSYTHFFDTDGNPRKREELAKVFARVPLLARVD